MSDTTKWLKDLEAKANAATPGPWANTDNVQEMFGVEPYNWWKVYAKNRKGLDHPMTVCSMTHRATEEEAAAARINEPMRDPGQAGKDAAFIAAANPEAAKRLVDMTRLAIDALIHIRDKKPAWCRNECTPCRPECVARHVLDAIAKEPTS